nr:MAG TPA: hypothetical protein [Siphoviridae sp. ctRJB2]DAJ52019.1 MAG TPA: hypothetical protein [Caudoviricetes sp.]
MSMKIIELSEAEFIYELTRSGSRVNQSPLQWTHEWLSARGASTKALNRLGDWSGASTVIDIHRLVRSDIICCINAVIGAKRSVGGQKSSDNMTPEQRRERAKKAAAASAAVRSAKAKSVARSKK